MTCPVRASERSRPDAMPTSFPGLTDADFDAYLPARATSNAFVRPRIEVKEKTLALGRALAERAASRGLALEVGASDERPSIWNKRSVTDQWVFLWRDKAARDELERALGHERTLDAALSDPTPYHRHAFLALHLDAEQFEVTVRVHRDAWADVKNTRSRLGSDEGRVALERALAGLGPDYLLGVTGGESSLARESDGARVASLLEAAVSTGAWLYVSRPMSRTDATAWSGDALDEWVLAAFDALLPVYALLAWRREDDLAAVTAELERERIAREAQTAALAAREAQWQAEHAAEIARRRERAVSEARERLAALEPVRPSAVPNPPRVPGARTSEPRVRTPAEPIARPPAGAPARTTLAPITNNSGHHGPAGLAAAAAAERPRNAATSAAVQQRPTAHWVEQPDEPVRPGSRIKVRTGAFAGRVGTVVDVDAHGEARVSLGPISARLEVDSLVALTEKR